MRGSSPRMTRLRGYSPRGCLVLPCHNLVLLQDYELNTQSHPREVSRTSRGWDRGRWPGNEGAKTDTPSRQPKLHGPGAPIRASLGALGGMPYRRCQPPRHVEAPAAVVRSEVGPES